MILTNELTQWMFIVIIFNTVQHMHYCMPIEKLIRLFFIYTSNDKITVAITAFPSVAHQLRCTLTNLMIPISKEEFFSLFTKKYRLHCFIL